MEEKWRGEQKGKKVKARFFGFLEGQAHHLIGHAPLKTLVMWSTDLVGGVRMHLTPSLTRVYFFALIFCFMSCRPRNFELEAFVCLSFCSCGYTSLFVFFNRL